jgi:hypothetical protein
MKYRKTVSGSVGSKLNIRTHRSLTTSLVGTEIVFCNVLGFTEDAEREREMSIVLWILGLRLTEDFV